MHLPLTTALAAVVAVCATIVIAKGKDPQTKVVCGVTAVLALVVGLQPHVHLLRDLISPTLAEVFAVATGVAAVLCGIRAGNAILATLLIATGIQLGLCALELIRT